MTSSTPVLPRRRARCPGSSAAGGRRTRRTSLAVDLEPLLAGFRHRPGRAPVDREHIGKWLHAATLAWDHTGDAALRSKLEPRGPEPSSRRRSPTVPRHLSGGPPFRPASRCRLGRLGPQVRPDRAARLSPVAPATSALDRARRRSATCCIRTFGTEPVGQRQPHRRGHACRHGRDQRPRADRRACIEANRGSALPRLRRVHRRRRGTSPAGPRILSTPAETGAGRPRSATARPTRCCRTSSACASSSGSTGDRRSPDPRRCRAPGRTSSPTTSTSPAPRVTREHFGAAHDLLPNVMSPNVGETCVTVTWLQLTQQLLRLTGEARLRLDELERTAYNQPGSPRSDRTAPQWCYYARARGIEAVRPRYQLLRLERAPRRRAPADDGLRPRAGRRDRRRSARAVERRRRQ